jgi:hypothetical protein
MTCRCATFVILLARENFTNASVTEKLKRAKVNYPRLQFSQANEYCSIKIEVLDHLVTEPAILRRLRGIQPVLSQNPRRTHRPEPNLSPQAAASSVNIIIAGVSVPEIQDLRGWVLESLGSDCLMAVTSRLVNIGGSQQRLVRCSLNSRCGLSADKVLSLLKQHWVGSEDAIISVEPEDIDTHPVVVIGSSKLPQAWPTIVPRWWRLSRNGLDGCKGPSHIE